MESILKTIIAAKQQEIARAKRRISPAQLVSLTSRSRRRVRDFKKSLLAAPGVALIAELKKASPIKGWLHRGMSLTKTAKMYERNGAAAISVLTDSHFKGTLSDLHTVRQATRLPLLRKDFILNEYQVYESFLAGADAVLLIAAIVPAKQLNALLDLVHELGMEALVEVHNAEELRRVDFSRTAVVGINNRNLSTFRVDLRTTERLARRIPKGIIVVCESGVSRAADVAKVKTDGVRAVLVGEGIVTAENMSFKVRELAGVLPGKRKHQ